ncbi:MAG: FadR/GntR family transcriptional regulator [Anaerolineae bacterium]
MARTIVDLTVFEPISPQRVSDSAVEQIRRLIEEGELQPGDRLPGERDLIRSLGVSRPSVREALRVLEGMGLIQVNPGVGTFVSPLAALSPTARRWDSWLKENPNEVWQLLEVAEVLDPQAAALAATRGTEEEVNAILASVEHMEKAIEANEIDGIIEADIDFHDAIARASHNKFLVELNENLNVTMETRRGGLSVPKLARESLRTHRAVANAIQARDPHAARQAMFEHIKKAEVAILSIELRDSAQEIKTQSESAKNAEFKR